MLSPMIESLAADLVMLIHFGFIVFVVAGGLAVLKWPLLAWLHLPALIWVAWLEFTGAICPLTPLENYLRRLAGEAGYSGPVGFQGYGVGGDVHDNLKRSMEAWDKHASVLRGDVKPFGKPKSP